MTTGFSRRVEPFGPYFAGMSYSGFRGNGDPTMSIVRYNAKLEKDKTLYSRPFTPRRRRRNVSTKINDFKEIFEYALGEKRVYIMDSQEFEIRMVDTEGKKLAPIKMDYKNISMNSALKKSWMDYYKYIRYKDSWDRMKNRLELPDQFPAIRDIHYSEGKIYVLTYKKEKENTEFFIFDAASSKLDKKVMVPLMEMNTAEYYPYTIKGSKLYQLVEDEDEEEWILHIHPF